MNLPSQLVTRDPDTTKIDYGHALLVAGSYGKMGCALLAARACLRSGAGLITAHTPVNGVGVLQSAFPEAMISIDESRSLFTSIPSGLDRFSAVAVGPGIGTDFATAQALLALLRCPILADVPMVLDADAINILAKIQDGRYPGLDFSWQEFRRPFILTPHQREYERLFGLQAPADVARQCRLILVCKSHHTHVYSPDGQLYVNSTGNAGMATAGSGDVLTGILLGLLSQGVTPFEAARLGVYLHGLAGDCAAERVGQASLIAGDIVDCLPEAILKSI